MLMRLLLFILLLSLAGAGYAQSLKKKKKKKASTENTQQGSPTSLNPNYSPDNYGPKRSEKRKSGGGPTYNSEREYFERLEALEKTRVKNERMAEKPQYSNPMYFGHKRPPKKRSPDKMKFCKVCGIRH